MDLDVINNIASALLDWANYIVDVQRGHILNEGSIKYAISEYLEVAKMNAEFQGRKNTGPHIISYEFEHGHPVFKKRNMDLYINYGQENINISEDNFFEFKYVRDASLSTDEAERYIDDVFRLYSILKNTDNSHSYLLIAGGEQNYNSVFGIQRRDRRTFDGQVTQNQLNISQLFGQILSQRYNGIKQCQVSNLQNSNNTKMIINFNKDYKYKTRKIKIEEDDIIKTKLVYSSKVDIKSRNTPITVKIWEIS